MRFHQTVQAYIDGKFVAHEALSAENDNDVFSILEDTHVIGQQATCFHCFIQYKIFPHGLCKQNWKVVFRHMIRIIGTATKTVSGLVPKGIAGGASISAFKRLPRSAVKQAILLKIDYA